MTSAARGSLRNTLLLIAIVVAWYVSSAICTASGKMVLTALAPKAGGCALTITALQFMLSGLVSGLACCILGRRPPNAPREVLLVSLSYTMGFLLLNCSLNKLQASFSETVRGLEPLSSFALVKFFGARGGEVTLGTAFALLTTLLGAALSVYSQPQFSHAGFAFGLAANCAFSSRGLLVTLLQDAMRRKALSASKIGGEKDVDSSPSAAMEAASSGAVDPIGLFAMQHALGLLLLLPAAMTFEGSHCAAALYDNPVAARNAAYSSLGFLTYNFLSLIVLLLIDAVSHSVCNTCRRAVTIVAAAIVFQNPVSPTSAAGIALIIGGAVAYAYTSAADKRRSAHATGRLGPVNETPDHEAPADTDALLEQQRDTESASEDGISDAGGAGHEQRNASRFPDVRLPKPSAAIESTGHGRARQA